MLVSRPRCRWHRWWYVPQGGSAFNCWVTLAHGCIRESRLGSGTIGWSHVATAMPPSRLAPSVGIWQTNTRSTKQLLCQRITWSHKRAWLTRPTPRTTASSLAQYQGDLENWRMNGCYICIFGISIPLIRWSSQRRATSPGASGAGCRKILHTHEKSGQRNATQPILETCRQGEWQRGSMPKQWWVVGAANVHWRSWCTWIRCR